MSIVLTELQKRRLNGFFGAQGANIIQNHIDKLEETFGSSAVIIKSVMDGKIEVPIENAKTSPRYHITFGKPRLRSDSEP